MSQRHRLCESAHQRLPLRVLRICWGPACPRPEGVGHALMTLSRSVRFCALSSSTCMSAVFWHHASILLCKLLTAPKQAGFMFIGASLAATAVGAKAGMMPAYDDPSLVGLK